MGRKRNSGLDILITEPGLDRTDMEFNLHGCIERSVVNGPGERYVIHTQGCSRHCPGCYNQDALPKEPRNIISVDNLFEDILKIKGIDGITLSGGEPLEQMEPCIELSRRLKRETGLSVVIYTGYGANELPKLPRCEELMKLADVMVTGPYQEERHCHRGILGSSNQEILFLSDRYTLSDLDYPGEFEIHIAPDGYMLITGIVPQLHLINGVSHVEDDDGNEGLV